MSMRHVQERWNLYRLLVKIMYASINDKIVLNSPASPVRDFPANRTQWSDWALAVAALVSLADALEVTDQALSQAADLLAATHALAASIKVDVPKADVVRELIDNLELVNEEIKQDQRFHAALEIGLALSDAIKKARSLPA
jgi:hypothetical protein